MNPAPAPNRTGVVLGVANLTAERAALIREHMEAHFPGVVFAIVEGASSVSFEFWDPYPRDEDDRT